MTTSPWALIYFAKFSNILGNLSFKLENHNGILLLRKSRRLTRVFYFRFFSCFLYCFYLLCRTVQSVQNSHSFSHLQWILLTCWIIVYSLVLVFLTNTFLRDDLVTFWSQISKFRHSSQRSANDAGESGGYFCIQTNFIRKASIAFGVVSTLFNVAAAWVHTLSPKQPM